MHFQFKGLKKTMEGVFTNPLLFNSQHWRDVQDELLHSRFTVRPCRDVYKAVIHAVAAYFFACVQTKTQCVDKL